MKKNKYFQLLKSVINNDPVYLIFFVTAKCNSRCKMCFNWKSIDNAKNKKELTLEEVKKISGKFPDMIYLTISGGEPFLRNDLSEIISTFIENNHVQFVSIPTNGFFTKKIISASQKLFKRYPWVSFRVSLSIDGIGKKHDYIRGTKGNFKKLLETYKGLDNLRKKHRNFNIDVSTAMSKFNQDEIIEIFEWVKKNLKIDNHVLAYTRGQPRVPEAADIPVAKYKKAVEYVEQRTIEKEDRRKTLALLLLKAIKLVMRDVILETKKRNRQIIQCLAGKKMVVMTEEGDIFPCELLDMKMGNIRKVNYDIRKILKSKEGMLAIKWIKDNKCFCTFECSIQNSLAYNLSNYPRIMSKFIKVLFKKKDLF